MPVAMQTVQCEKKGWEDIKMVQRKNGRLVPQDYIEYQVPFTSIKQQEDGTLFIEGYGSTPDLDSYNDTVLASAFSKEVALKRYHENPLILRGHDDSKIIGVMVEDRVDTGGWRVRAHLKYDVEDTFSMIKDGVVRGYSIGFIPRAMEYYHIDGRKIEDIPESEWETINVWTDIKRVISELEIYELSVVNLPANPNTLFTMSKAVKSYFTDLIPSDMKLTKEDLLSIKQKAMNGEPADPVETEEVEAEDLETPETLDAVVADEASAEVKDAEAPVVDDEEETGEDEATDGDDKEDLSETDGAVVPAENAEPAEEEAQEEDTEEKVFGLKHIQVLSESVKTLQDTIEEMKEANKATVDFAEKLFVAFEELGEAHLDLVAKFNAMPKKLAMTYTGKANEGKAKGLDVKASMLNAREKAGS